MSGHVISSLASSLASKLEVGKKKPNKGDVAVVTDEKRDDMERPKINPNNPGIKLYKKKQHFTDKELKYERVTWRHLPKEARVAAESAGYDKAKWDNNERLPNLDKSWRRLSSNDKTAMETLGWDKLTWDDRYHDYGWRELPELQQRAAALAGYSRDNWWDGPDHLKKKYWKDLTDDEKQGMTVLGWTENNWD